MATQIKIAERMTELPFYRAPSIGSSTTVCLIERVAPLQIVLPLRQKRLRMSESVARTYLQRRQLAAAWITASEGEGQRSSGSTRCSSEFKDTKAPPCRRGQ